MDDETFTGDELAWLRHQAWLLANSTRLQVLADAASKLETVLAKLDQGVVITLRRSD